MITLFRIHSFLQVFGILLVLVLVKLLYGIGSLPLLKPELEWLLVGEKVSQGFIPYKEVWTFSSPITTLLYAFISGFGYQNLFNFDIAALILVFFQSLQFNLMCSNRRILMEKSYLPALMYITVIGLSFDLQKLTPPLIATTFVILVLNSVIKQLETTQKSANFGFEIGFFIGMAALAHLPTLTLLVWAIICLSLFSSFDFRQLILVFLGFGLPVLGFSIFFSFNDALPEFRQQWLESILDIKAFSISNFTYALLVLMLPIALTVLGVFRIFSISRYNSYQNKAHQTILFLAVALLVGVLLADNSAPYQFSLMAPVFAFFIAALFLHMRGVFLTESVFLVYFGLILLGASLQTGLVGNINQKALESLKVEVQKPNPYANKKLLILGENNSSYLGSKPSTKYLNWDISKSELENPDTYQEVIAIYKSFKNDMPEIILDQKNVLPSIFKLLPDLQKRYKKKSSGVYILI